MEWDIIIVRVIGIIVVLITGWFIYTLMFNDCCMCGVVTNDCCPCPNNEWFDTVEEWYGNEASSAGSWLYMCEEYQKANNVTFDCFN